MFMYFLDLFPVILDTSLNYVHVLGVCFYSIINTQRLVVLKQGSLSCFPKAIETRALKSEDKTYTFETNSVVIKRRQTNTNIHFRSIVSQKWKCPFSLVYVSISYAVYWCFPVYIVMFFSVFLIVRSLFTCPSVSTYVGNTHTYTWGILLFCMNNIMFKLRDWSSSFSSKWFNRLTFCFFIVTSHWLLTLFTAFSVVKAIHQPWQ